MKVLFLAAYSEMAAASRIKVYQFLPFLEKRGVHCKVICFAPSFVYRLRLASADSSGLLLVYYPLSYVIKLFSIVRAIILASQFDAVYIQEPIIPFGFVKMLKLANKNIIFQCTDAVFISDQKGQNIFERLRLKMLYNAWKRAVKIATCCLVENEYNKKAVEPYCSYIETITGPIDTDRYFFREDKTREPAIVIGWAGSPFTTKYLYGIAEALREIAKKYSIILRTTGAKKDFTIEGVSCEVIPWKLNTELDWLSTFDIGIMPLSDDAWTKGKGGYKLLQYMSMGIPAIASPVGFNKEVVLDGVNGFLATTREEWLERLSLLIENKELGKSMAKKARSTIEEQYSLHRAELTLFTIFKNIISHKA